MPSVWKICRSRGKIFRIRAVAHYSLAAIKASLGAYDLALSYINEAIRINPTFAPSYLAQSKINCLCPAKPFAIIVVQNVQKPERPAIAEPVSHKVHRPGFVWSLRNRQLFRSIPYEPFARLNPQIKL